MMYSETKLNIYQLRSVSEGEGGGDEGMNSHNCIYHQQFILHFRVELHKATGLHVSSNHVWSRGHSLSRDLSSGDFL